MLIEIIISILLGTLIGTISGLIPGLHINLIGTLLLSLYLFLKVDPLFLSIFIIALSITHIFVNFIPSVFLGCPNTENHLSILPAHQLLIEGRGYEAVKLTSIGGIYASIILIIIAYPLSSFLFLIYDSLSELMFFILLIIFLIFILIEKRKLNTLFIFLISGILGILTLNLGIKEPLLPLFVGLFGFSNIIISLRDKIELPSQKITIPRINKKPVLVGSIITSPLCGFLPGLGAGQASILANIVSKSSKEEFLFLNGIINNLIMGLSIVSLYSISKTRTGTAVIIKELLGNFSWKVLLIFLLTILISSIISFFITDFLSKNIIKRIKQVNYTKISKSILFFLLIFIFIFSGPLGILVLFASTILGIYCDYLKVKKANMMGCLLLPTMIYYLFKIII